MMNLMVGVVVDQFTSTSIRENMCVPQTAVLEFVEEWGALDPEGTGLLSAHYLPKLLVNMRQPLGVRDDFGGGRRMQLAVLRRLEEAWLPLRAGQISFQECLFGLARCQAGQRLPDCELRTALDKQARKVLDLRHLRAVAVEWNAHEFFAAEIIQRTYRGFRAREKMHTSKQKHIKMERVLAAFRISSTLLTSFVDREIDACASALACTARGQPTHSGFFELD